jgi:hypothetical protein
MDDAQPARTDHLTRLVADDAGAIAREMWSRIEGDISEKDELAIGTAITKVAIASVRRASAEVAAQVAESGIQVQIQVGAQEAADEWAERYGQADD